MFPREEALIALAVARETGDAEGVWHAWHIASVDADRSGTLDLIFSRGGRVPLIGVGFDLMRDNINVYRCQRTPRSAGGDKDLLVAIFDPYEPNEPHSIVRVQVVAGTTPPPAPPAYVLDIRGLVAGDEGPRVM